MSKYCLCWVMAQAEGSFSEPQDPVDMSPGGLSHKMSLKGFEVGFGGGSGDMESSYIT